MHCLRGSPPGWSVFLACAAACAAIWPLAAGAGGAVRIPVTARVLEVLRVHVSPLQSAVRVAEGERSVRLAPAAALDVFCNARSCEIALDIVDPAALDVEVQGLGAPLRIGGSGARVRLDMAAGHRFQATLDYTVRYAEGTPAGERVLPLVVRAADP